jgi:hypothetical protein
MSSKLLFFAFRLLAISLIFFQSCKKKDEGNAAQPPPVVITDSGLFRINSATKTDVNEFNINYHAVPPPGESYSNLYLIWSTSSSFLTGKDSLNIAPTTSLAANQLLPGLKQSTTYYGRIGLTLKGKRYYSTSTSFTTDTFKIVVAGYFDPSRGFSKDDTSIVFTNLKPVAPRIGSDTKVFFGNYECTIVSDQGLTIEYNVPASIPAGKYRLKVFSRGMEAFWPDSVEVLRGIWQHIAAPTIPVNPNATTAGLVFFGTCYSAQKGYLVGGIYLNGPPVSYPNSQWPEYIIEFNALQQSWTKRIMPAPQYFENPHCYYYNNGIYVVSAHNWTTDIFGNQHGMSLKKIKRLDLGSLTWTDVSDVPYPTIFNLASFELNNEFYIGMGADSANRTVCCGTPIPSKKFWKFNPASNQWTPLADFPGDHQDFPTCFTIGSKAYAFYGAVPITSTDFKKELWEYNPTINTWLQIPLPATGGPSAGEKYQISGHNGKAYFISSQNRSLFGGGYGYLTSAPCLEWDPIQNSYKPVAFPYDSHILKTMFKQGNTYYYKTDATGYFESVPNKVYSFTIEQ